jgi:hypothetical protein
VIARRTLVALGGLTIFPGSWIAAQSQPVAPKQTVGRPASVGKFQLSQVPRQGGLALGLVPAGTKRLVIDGRDVPFAPDRRFLIGFGRDFGATCVITAFLANGDSVTDKLQVIPTQWRIENLKTVARYPQPSAEFQARRPAELAQINAARRIRPSSDGWRMRFVWPAKGRISGVFGSQRIYAGEPGAPHNGTDIAGPAGASVYAPADGVVTLAARSPFTLEGNLLIIDHGMGLDSAFLHLSRIDVKMGDRIVQGQRIGAIGATGRASGPHLHWGMKWNDERVDPQQLAGPM